MFRFLLLEYSSIVDSLYSVAIVCLFFLNGKVEPVLFSDVNESNCSRLCLERLNPKIPRRIVFFLCVTEVKFGQGTENGKRCKMEVE